MKKIIALIIVGLLSFTFIACNGNDDKEDTQVIDLINLIDSIPDPVTLDDESLLNNIESKYQSLSSSQTSKITNYSDYTKAKEQMNQLKYEEAEKVKASNVSGQIDDLDNISTLDYADQIEMIGDVVTAYNALSEYAKDKVTNYNKLQSYITLSQNLTSAISIQSQIDDLLKGEITIDSETTVQQARDLYANAGDVMQYLSEDKIVEAENKIAELKTIQELKEKAQVVIDLISALPALDKLTVSDASKVSTARNRYSSLTSAAKPYVTNLETLEKAENKIKELKQIEADKKAAKAVDDAIGKLPSKDNLTLEDKDSVAAVRSSYDLLTSAQKAYVTKLSTLTTLEAQIEYLIANHEYIVKFYLNGGELNGETASDSTKTVTSFNVNYYSTGFWGHYKTDVVIFKTTNIPAEDYYTSALKFGFSYDSTASKYIVDQTVAAGTKLESKTSDYYILVHSDYAAGYAEVSYINIGDIIETSVDFPSSYSESWGTTITVKRNQTVNYIEKEYHGTNTLDVPTKFGYDFMGWYETSNFTGNKVTEVSDSKTLYAKWGVKTSEVTTETILNCVSDVATSGTNDELVLENTDAKFTWTSSNNNLYKINGNSGVVNMSYQTHQNQNVTITCKINYKAGGSKTVSKQITVGPVNYAEMSSSPMCTYFATGAAYSYKQYNTRYVKTKTFFSEDTKNTLDIVYYSFIYINADGTCALGTEEYVEEVNDLKNYNVRIVASISGTSDTTSKYFANITADATKCKAFAKNLMDLVDKYRFDGLDIDWESTSAQYVVASGMNRLSKDLKDEMAARQAAGGTPYLLTAAVPASSWGLASDRYDFVTLNNYLDYINIMSYDANRSDRCSHLCPFYSSAKDNGYGFGGVYGVNQISAKGFAKNKLIMGCAGYGKAYSITASTITNNGLGCAGKLIKISAVESYGSFSSGTLYGGAVQALLKNSDYVSYDEYNGGLFVGSYLYNAKSKIFVTYESALSVQEKYKYALKNNVGLMCWAYTEDTADIVINAITEAKKAN